MYNHNNFGMKRNLRKAAENAFYYFLNDPIRVMAVLLVIVITFNVAITRNLYFEKEFKMNLLAETHGLVFDILVLGIFVVLINRAADRKKTILTCQQEISDMKTSRGSDYAHFRILSNIKMLNNCKIHVMDLMNADISGSNMQGVNLQGSNLVYLIARDSDLTKADLSFSRMASADFTDATLTQANMEGVYAKDANFKDAGVEHTVFFNAKLISANFSGARCNYTNFAGANLIGAIFQDATLFGADFRNCKDLSPVEILKARVLINCIFDDHFQERLQALQASTEELSSMSEDFLKVVPQRQHKATQTASI